MAPACGASTISPRRCRPGQFDGWLLFYRAVLGLAPDATWELPDPYGWSAAAPWRAATARSGFRSTSPTEATPRPRGSVSTFAGAGIHHIAFATDDIFAAAHAWQASGVPVLPMPANYYDDLAARFDLRPTCSRGCSSITCSMTAARPAAICNASPSRSRDRFFIEAVQRPRRLRRLRRGQRPGPHGRPKPNARARLDPSALAEVL
ncbi:MAG: VOC family protein [Pseudomonadota bacterium]